MNRGALSGHKPEYLGRFISPPQALPAAGTPLIVSHGLGQVPSVFLVSMVCVLADVGYVAGDVIPLNATADGAGGPAAYTPMVDAKECRLVYNAAWTIANKTSGARGAITLANWRVIFYGAI